MNANVVVVVCDPTLLCRYFMFLTRYDVWYVILWERKFAEYNSSRFPFACSLKYEHNNVAILTFLYKASLITCFIMKTGLKRA